jgi:hypothetical protein
VLVKDIEFEEMLCAQELDAEFVLHLNSFEYWNEPTLSPARDELKRMITSKQWAEIQADPVKRVKFMRFYSPQEDDEEAIELEAAFVEAMMLALGYAQTRDGLNAKRDDFKKSLEEADEASIDTCTSCGRTMPA